MKRHQSYGLILILGISLWSILFTFRTVFSSPGNFIITVIPWYLLICLGCYCLGKLGLDIACFNDYPEATLKLEKEIIIAKADLEKKGFKFS
mmetsp:Transcript_26948/g.27181  ORF Transcript_26948/g.27181 Transcript_26948/m.27181 type:complete len:92 (+) Transcript_26948:289-564(+)